MSEELTIATHSGTFHVDEVFAVAALRLAHRGQTLKVVRTRDEEIIATADIAVDVGTEYDPSRKRFDHHQAGGAGERDNRIPYAAFGLVWRSYGEEISGSVEVARRVDEKLIQTIDALDNGVDLFAARPELYHYHIHDLIFAFRPTWRETNRSNDDAFFEVLEFAERLLAREIILARDSLEGEKRVEAAYEAAPDKRLIELDNDDYPWLGVLLRKPEPLLVLLPDSDQEGNWKIKTVKQAFHTFDNRLDLPATWAGKRGEELQMATGVPDALFCHNKRFIAVAGSRAGALALAALALNQV